MEGKANNKYSNLPAGWEMKRLKDVAINCGASVKDIGAGLCAVTELSTLPETILEMVK